MLDGTSLLSRIPTGLRTPLLAEYDSIVQAYFEGRWTPAELSGGRFCEIVYTILDGHSSGSFASSPSKPRNFIDACRRLENNAGVPRSFQILIPRILPALYEVRNNRGVGHVGGDVDPNRMDAGFVIGTVKWILAELIRVFHAASPEQADRAVQQLATIAVPLVWDGGDVRRVLDPKTPLNIQVLLLAGTVPSGALLADIERYIESKTAGYLIRTVRKLHSDRLIDFNEPTGLIRVLPPGAAQLARHIAKKTKS
jgi:hypothetical protein